MLPVNAVMASASFSSLLALRFSCSRRSRKASMLLRSAELNSPSSARSSAVGLDDTRNSARDGWRSHSCQAHLGNTLLGEGGIVSCDCMVLQIVVTEVCKSHQGAPVPDFQTPRVPLHQFEMPQLLNDAVGVNV